jgi:hypothetical protein
VKRTSIGSITWASELQEAIVITMSTLAPVKPMIDVSDLEETFARPGPTCDLLEKAPDDLCGRPAAWYCVGRCCLLPGFLCQPCYHLLAHTNYFEHAVLECDCGAICMSFGEAFREVRPL